MCTNVRLLLCICVSSSKLKQSRATLSVSLTPKLASTHANWCGRVGHGSALYSKTKL